MIALSDLTFGCPYCKVTLRLRQGAEIHAGTCPNCHGWLQAPERTEANPGAFTALSRSRDANGILPPRRAGAPPRLLGDHPAQIAQTSVPKDASLPDIDRRERQKKVRAARRKDNIKMVALSVMVFGLVLATIQWTRMGGMKNDPSIEDQPSVGEVQPQPDTQAGADIASEEYNVLALSE